MIPPSVKNLRGIYKWRLWIYLIPIFVIQTIVEINILHVFQQSKPPCLPWTDNVLLKLIDHPWSDRQSATWMYGSSQTLKSSRNLILKGTLSRHTSFQIRVSMPSFTLKEAPLLEPMLDPCQNWEKLICLQVENCSPAYIWLARFYTRGTPPVPKQVPLLLPVKLNVYKFDQI
jgi:hypothetical protein